MKVLFAGTPGVRKSIALQSLRLAVEQLDPTGPRIFTLTDDRVPILDHLLYHDNPHAFFDLPQETQKARWRETFENIHDEFDKAQTEHHFLGVHFTYRHQQTSSCVASFSQLIDWNPDCIITFIDDAYCVRQRIHDGGYRSFTLSELVLWRAEEVLVGDLLARVINPRKPPPNYVVSVRHSPEMLTRLLIEPKQTTRFYTAYNITSTRNDESGRKIVDRFRRTFRDQAHCAAFDPLTIDELPPVAKYLRPISASPPQQLKKKTARKKKADTRTLQRYDPTNSKHRWPTRRSLAAALASDEDLRGRTLRIPVQELADAAAAIDAQIKTRDFRLLEQGHYLVVYRPTIKGASIGTGVQAEIAHAQHIGRPLVWYLKRGEDSLPSSPFLPKDPDADPNFIYERTDKAFWERIARLEPLPQFDHFLY